MVRNSFLRLLLSLILTLSFSGVLFGELQVEPGLVDFGRVPGGEVVSRRLTLANNGAEPLELSLSSSLPGLELTPQTLRLPPGGEAVVILTLVSDETGGEFSTPLIVSSREGDALVWLNGAREGSLATGAVPDKENPDRVDLYYSARCIECGELIADLKDRYGERLILHDTDGTGELAALFQRLQEKGAEIEGFPVLFAEGGVADGFAMIERFLDGSAGAAKSDGNRTGFRVSGMIPLLPLIGAGLLDGVNPCAFATLIFFVSLLVLNGRGRRSILVTGLSYGAGVLVSYYALGAGFLSIAGILPLRERLSSLLELALLLFLAVMAGISFRDYLLARKGRFGELTLRLSPAVHRRVHGLLRLAGGRLMSVPLTVLMSFLIGVLVALLELGCTGQVYLPAVGYILKVRGDASGYLYLLVYNLAFITPLLILLAAVVAGVSSRRLAAIFESGTATVRLLFFLLFLVLILLLVLL